MTGLDDLAALWRQARRVVVLTGAGLSTASGIPDFRSPGGRWERYRPVPLPEFLADEDARERYWRYKGETWQLIRTALPNAGHRALTDLALAGRLHLLVTQNVDGLHERSGFPRERLVDIHGTDSEVECMGCHRRAERAVAQDAWEAGTAVPTVPAAGRGSQRPSRSVRRSTRQISRARSARRRPATCSSPLARRSSSDR